MNIAIMGGTFNPIHIGHLLLAKEVIAQYPLDKILFIPSHIPAHKKIEGNITVQNRVDMVKLAIQDMGPAFEFDSCEVMTEGISYSIDTIFCVKKKYPECKKPYLIIGDDVFLDFDKWRNPDLIIQEAQLLIAHRDYEKKIQSPYPHSYINNKILNISSTEIRNMVKQGKIIDYLVPQSVIKYIIDNKLYV